MLIGFPTIFVADTKIIYGYNFVAPLKSKTFMLRYLTSSQVSNCDGAVLQIYLGHKFQWPQEGLTCKSLAYEAVT